MAIFILSIEKILGLTEPIRVIDEANTIFIVWQADIDQSIQIQLSLAKTVGNTITINHCFDNTDNVFLTEDIAVNSAIQKQILHFTKDKKKVISYVNPILEEYINDQISTIQNNLDELGGMVTAENIFSLMDNSNNSNVITSLSDGKIYFQANKSYFLLNKVFQDFTGTATIDAATAIVNTTLTNVTLIAPDELTFTAKPFYDMYIQNATFAAVRAMELWTTINTVVSFVNTYKHAFAVNLDTSNLGEEFVEVNFTNCTIKAASPSFSNANFTGFPATASASIKMPTTCFRIKQNNVPIVAIPLTTARVTSTATTNLLNASFLVNNASFLIGAQAEVPKMYNYLSVENAINWGTATPTITLDSTIPDNAIYNLYITNNSPEVSDINLPTSMTIFLSRILKTVPVGQDLGGFKLRLICNLGLSGRTVVFKDPLGGNITSPDPAFIETYFSYTTNTTDIFEIINIDCKWTAVSSDGINSSCAIRLSAPRVLQNQTYYDWLYQANIADKNTLMKATTNTTALTDAQYARFNLNRPIRLSQSLNAGETFLLQNLKFYYLRGDYVYYTTAAQTTVAYSTTQYKDNCLITITITNPSTKPTLIIGKNLAFQNVVPVGNNKMFPLTTAVTTNRTVSYGAEPLRITVNNVDLVKATNTNKYADKILNFKYNVFPVEGTINFIPAPVDPLAIYKRGSRGSNPDTIRLADNTIFLLYDGSVVFGTWGVFLKNSKCSSTLIYSYHYSSLATTNIGISSSFAINLGGSTIADTGTWNANVIINENVTTYNSSRFTITQTREKLPATYNPFTHYLRIKIDSDYDAINRRWIANIDIRLVPW